MDETIKSVGEVFASAAWRAVWQGGLFALAVLLLFQAIRRVPPAIRGGAYWLASLKMLLGAAIPLAIAVPLLPTAPVRQLLMRVPGGLVQTAGPEMTLNLATAAPMPFPWKAALFAAWLVGFAVALERLVVQHRQVRALLRGARALEHPRITAAINDLSLKAGLRRPPDVFVSDEVNTPLVAGLFAPRILLPASALERLDDDALRMTLAHELAHVSRKDLWAGWVPAMADAALWFFPLARVCRREYAQAREEACDRAALVLTGAAPSQYGQLLLAFGLARRETVVSAACGASPHFRHLERRLLLLQERISSGRAPLWRVAVVLGIVALLPLRVAAREGQEQIPASRVVASAELSDPSPDGSRRTSLHGTTVEHSEDGYVLFQGDRTTMRGSDDDLSRSRSLRSRYGGTWLWMKRSGHEYIVTDPNALRAVGALFDSQRELGDRQAALGERQAQLGQVQARIGQHQAELGYEQIRGGDQEALNRKQDAFNREQDALNKQQDALNAQQDELNRQQERVSRETDGKFASLVDEWVAKGIAKPLQ